jgi:hypothetical protein
MDFCLKSLKFEDNKGVIRRRKSKKDILYNIKPPPPPQKKQPQRQTMVEKTLYG